MLNMAAMRIFTKGFLVHTEPKTRLFKGDSNPNDKYVLLEGAL